jgi:hypothetical protein
MRRELPATTQSALPRVSRNLPKELAIAVVIDDLSTRAVTKCGAIVAVWDSPIRIPIGCKKLRVVAELHPQMSSENEVGLMVAIEHAARIT